MRGALILFCFFASFPLLAQWDLSEIECSEDYDHVHVEKLATDSLGSSFLIWVKDEVKSHLHQFHTESIYVLEGTGVMTVGDSTFSIHEGSFIFVPFGTFHSVSVTSEIPLKVLSNQSPQFLGKDRIYAGQLKRE